MKDLLAPILDYDPFEPVTQRLQEFGDKFKLYFILGVIALIVLVLLLDTIRKYIRGLDIAAVGGLFLWVSSKIDETPIIKGLCGVFTTIGETLLIGGLAVFIILRVTHYLLKRRKQKKLKEKYGGNTEDPAEMLEALLDCGILTEHEYNEKMDLLEA